MEHKDTEQFNGAFQGQVSSPSLDNAFVSKHLTMSFILKKTEKIATAVYMVTDFLADSEPLRIELRTSSLKLVSIARQIASRSSEPQYVLSDELTRTTEAMDTLITIATTIGLISEMNGAILATELNNVRVEVAKQYGEKRVSIVTHPGYSNVILTEELFAVESKGQSFDKGQIKQYNPRPATLAPKGVSEATASVGAQSVIKKTDIGNKIARRNDVLNIIRAKKKVSIKDISQIMKDMSEKTIQRELLALVGEGVLVKEGEKRWSTYRIAS